MATSLSAAITTKPTAPLATTPVVRAGVAGGLASLAAVALAATGEAALRLGREISFGNFLCGGPAGVPAILSDSNVDWGQEEGKIFERVRRGDLRGRAGVLEELERTLDGLGAGVRVVLERLNAHREGRRNRTRPSQRAREISPGPNGVSPNRSCVAVDRSRPNASSESRIMGLSPQ